MSQSLATAQRAGLDRALSVSTEASVAVNAQSWRSGSAWWSRYGAGPDRHSEHPPRTGTIDAINEERPRHETRAEASLHPFQLVHQRDVGDRDACPRLGFIRTDEASVTAERLVKLDDLRTLAPTTHDEPEPRHQR